MWKERNEPFSSTTVFLLSIHARSEWKQFLLFKVYIEYLVFPCNHLSEVLYSHACCCPTNFPFKLLNVHVQHLEGVTFISKKRLPIVVRLRFLSLCFMSFVLFVKLCVQLFMCIDKVYFEFGNHILIFYWYTHNKVYWYNNVDVVLSEMTCQEQMEAFVKCSERNDITTPENK